MINQRDVSPFKEGKARAKSQIVMGLNLGASWGFFSKNICCLNFLLWYCMVSKCGRCKPNFEKSLLKIIWPGILLKSNFMVLQLLVRSDPECRIIIFECCVFFAKLFVAEVFFEQHRVERYELKQLKLKTGSRWKKFYQKKLFVASREIFCSGKKLLMCQSE